MLFFRVRNYSAKVQIIYQLANLLISKLGSAYPSSHTRLRQLADFPSLILRSSYIVCISFV